MPGMMIIFCSFLIFLGYCQPLIFHSKDVAVLVGELMTPPTLKKLEMVNNKLIEAKRAYVRLIETGKMIALFQHKQTRVICAETYEDVVNDRKAMMHIAAQEGLPNAIHILIKCGAEVNPRDCKSQTPLMLASFQGNVDSVIELLNHGADPNLSDADEKTALHHAAHENHHCIINTLLKHGAAINDIDKYLQSPLLIASMFGYIDSVEVLLCNNADPDLQDYNGTALHYAAQNDWLEGIETLLKHGAVIDEIDKQLIIKCKDDKGKTALHYAAQNDHLDIIETLLKHGVNVDDTNEHLQTSLMIASKQGNVDSVDMLLKNGADPNLQDSNGKTALHHSAQNHSCSFGILLQHRADPNTRDFKGKKVIHIVAQQNRPLEIVMLLKYGAVIDEIDKQLITECKDDKGKSALHYAAQNDRPEEIVMLLKYGAVIDEIDRQLITKCKDDKGKTALHYAAQNDHPEEIEILLKYGAVIDEIDKQLITECKDDKGKSALHYAAQNDHLDVIETLLRNGVHVDETDKYLQTSLMIASKKGNIDSVDMLLKNGADATRMSNFKRTAHGYAVYQLNFCKSLFRRSDPYLKNANEKTSHLYVYRDKYKKCISHLDYTVNNKWLYKNFWRNAIRYVIITQIIFFVYYIYSEFVSPQE